MANYVIKKIIDWSVLHQGFTVPIDIQLLFHEKLKKYLMRGQKREIGLIINNKRYSATLINQKFDENKYSGHKDLLQIRYKETSELAKALRVTFTETFKYIEKNKTNNKLTKIPTDRQEYLTLYDTPIEKDFYCECVTASDIGASRLELYKVDESNYEQSVNYYKEDHGTDIIMKTQVVKVRRLDRSISETLKTLYDNHCQICLEEFRKKYGIKVSESHHIEYFVKSLNNNSSNIIIVCPNHHRIIHKAKPLFSVKSLSFSYENGLIEKLQFNKHL